MLRSLFSGVTGLQSHQIAMDVESNNIANVNTIGYKYSRANFSDLLAQTNQIATAPQGQLGGKNAVQIGLGTTVSSITRIHSQGSIQNTDKNTDVAIQGDGFFIVSSDGGNTYKYSRSGDFKFDALGNFVDNNGFIVQGWLRDETTGLVDATAPITNIQIPPGLTTPAQATSEVVIKANLSSGDHVDQFKPIYALDTTTGTLAGPDGTTVTLDDDKPEFFNVLFDANGDALNLQAGQGLWMSYKASQIQTVSLGTPTATGPVNFTLNGTTFSVNVLGTDSGAQVAAKIAASINANTAVTGVFATPNAADPTQLILTNDNTRGTTSATKNIDLVVTGANGTGLTGGGDITAFQYNYLSAGAIPITEADASTTARQFTTTEDLRAQMQYDANLIGDDHSLLNDNAYSAGITVTVNDKGQFEIKNPITGDQDSYDMRIAVTGLTGIGVVENVRLTQNFQSLAGTLTQGSSISRFTQPFNAATHSASIDVYDSLGTKHTLRIDFRKYTLSASGGTDWTYEISVPTPGDIGGIINNNELLHNLTQEQAGILSFGNAGALSNATVSSITYTANNGSAPNQTINLNFGTLGNFDGMTSFDNPSGTSGISQDGYPGGDLVGIRIDQSGTLVGSFSNGRSFGLAQIGMAKFANNEGLVTDGGNVYLQSANSGDPIIGTAATAGRGFMQSSALEASNVDLSKSLTNLIIIQRGYQANGKTITTSDTLLETLIGLKR